MSNSRLNTCLWFGEYRARDDLGTVHDEVIVDVYSNKPVIEFVEENGKQLTSISEQYFRQQKDKLLDAETLR
jgi:hypothetical protein